MKRCGYIIFEGFIWFCYFSPHVMVLKQMERWIGDGPKRTSQLTTHESP